MTKEPGSMREQTMRKYTGRVGDPRYWLIHHVDHALFMSSYDKPMADKTDDEIVNEHFHVLNAISASAYRIDAFALAHQRFQHDPAEIQIAERYSEMHRQECNLSNCNTRIATEYEQEMDRRANVTSEVEVDPFADC